MKMRTYLLIIAILLPFESLAAPANVQSGEHAAFTRLVTPLQGPDWSIVQTGREVVLTFEGFSGGFDTSNVFDFIPRDRIQNLVTTDEALTLTLACDCAVSATIERGLYVVIDVANNISDLQTAALETSAPSDQEDAPVIPFDLARPEAKPVLPSESLTSSTLPETAPSEVIERLQSRLSAELQTAARRGVLNPAPNPFSMTPAKRTTIDTDKLPTQKLAKVPVKIGEQVATTETAELANLRISTSRDLPQTFRDLAEITNITGQICPQDSAMQVGNWGDTRPFAEQIAEAREGLFGELDRIDADAAITLARTYLYFGFGAEARSILMLDPKIAAEEPYLMTIAQIMDGEEIPSNNALSKLLECKGQTTLWAMLAVSDSPTGAFPKSESALRALNMLPAHLRMILAPKLQQVLRTYGDPAGAATTMRSLDRITGDLPAAAMMAKAETNLRAGNTGKAAEILTEVVEENSDLSPKALITLIDVKLKAKQPVTSQTASLVAAYAQELRESDLGPELRRAHVLSLVQSGQFDLAFKKSASLGGNDMTQAAQDLRHQLLRALTVSASDIVFLDQVFEQSDTDIASLSTQDIERLAERFLTLGFPAHAEKVLAAVTDTPKPQSARLLSAQVSLAMGKPLLAQADLIGLDNKQANSLRADANRMSGALVKAHHLYLQLDRQKDATETAWLSEDWRSLTASDTPVFGSATMLTDNVETDGSTKGMLARTNSILAQSAQARQTLQNLLTAEDLKIEARSE